jgi:hypothetical protein
MSRSSFFPLRPRLGSVCGLRSSRSSSLLFEGLWGRLSLRLRRLLAICFALATAARRRETRKLEKARWLATYPCAHTPNQPQIIPGRKLTTPLSRPTRARNIQMTQPTQRTRASCIHGRMLHGIRLLSRRRPRGARRTTRLPEVAEVLCEFLAGGGPVRLDGVAELDHVALEIEFVFLEPRDVEFLAAGAALELAVDVLVVVTDDPRSYQYCSLSVECW